MALTKNYVRDYEYEDNQAYIKEFAVATGIHIYQGAMVSLNASGYLTTSADTTDFKFVGLAVEEVDNSGGSDGDLTCKVKINTKTWIDHSGAAITDLGADFHASADDTLTDGAGSNTGRKDGRCIGYATDKLLIDFGQHT